MTHPAAGLHFGCVGRRCPAFSALSQDSISPANAFRSGHNVVSEVET